jgi:hypothetical protein
MPLIGVISREPRLSLEEWTRHIDASEIFVRKEPRVIKNPFTGKQVLLKPRPGNVGITVGGTILGGIGPGAEFFRDGVLEVFVPEGSDGRDLRVVAAGIAKTLGGKLEWFEETN